MGLPTDSYIDITIGGDVVDRIGLSAALSDITDISGVCFCGQYNNQLQNPGLYETLIPDSQVVNRQTPLRWDGSGFPIEFSYGNDSAYTAPGGMYGGVVWLYYIDGDDGSIPPDYCITANKISKYKLVTEWDAPHYVHYPEQPSKQSGEALYQYRYSSWSDPFTTYGIYDNYYGLNYKRLEYWSDNLKTDYVVINDIYPYQILEFNGKLYLLAFQYNHTKQGYYDSDSQTNNYNPYNLSYDSTERFASSLAFPHGTFDDGGDISTDNLPYSINSYGHLFVGVSADGNFVGEVETSASDLPDADGRLEMESWIYFHSRDAVYKYTANSGLKFYTDKLYKPIISGGVVVGYTDDMDEESELDEWTGTTDHGIGPTPPTPPPGPGYDDDPWNGATFAGVGVGGAGAFAKCYYMTSTELANLRSWMNSINVPEGFDPMQQIIGLSQVPVALSGDGAENVVFVNSSAVYDPGVTTRAVDTGVATQQAMGTPISYYLGSVDIVRRMQERGEPYLDYDCQIELYLPLIGMFSLDTQAVMGRTISAYAVLDPVSGTLAAYAYVSRDGHNLPIAYGSTTIGVDLPISAQQLSVSRAALKQANAQLGASLLSGALTMLAAASSSGKSSGAGAKTSTGSSGLSAAGIREAGSDYMKASQIGNVFGDFMNWGRTIRQLSYGNNTAVAGSFGGSTAQWSYPFTPYVKIIRPRYEKPSNYAHSQGVPCVQTKTIGSCTGFIQCIGVDVSGITGATDLELQAIQAALSNGIYAGGGQ